MKCARHADASGESAVPVLAIGKRHFIKWLMGTRAQLKLGYLVPQFPGQTHAFFWREAKAIEGWGIPVAFLSTRQTSPEDSPHAFDSEARERTHYAFPISLHAIIYLLSRIAVLPRLFGYVGRLQETGFVGRLKLLAMMLPAAQIASYCRSSGITHIHIHSCADAAHLGAFVKKLENVTYSLTLHGDLEVYGRDHAAKMREASLVTVVTRPLKEQVLSVLPNANVPVVTMGVDTEWFKPAAEKAPSDAFTLASVTRLNPTKGHKYTLRAIAELRDQGFDLKYLIAGEGPFRGAIEEEIRSLGLESHVTLLGSIGEKDVLALLQKADGLALTSFGLGEAAPVAEMEAMACGLPVICSNIGGTPDMIDHGVNGLLTEQQNVESVVEALRLLVSNPEKRETIGQAARQKAVDHFDYRPLARKLIGEIETSLGGTF